MAKFEEHFNLARSRDFQEYVNTRDRFVGGIQCASNQQLHVKHAKHGINKNDIRSLHIEIDKTPEEGGLHLVFHGIRRSEDFSACKNMSIVLSSLNLPDEIVIDEDGEGVDATDVLVAVFGTGRLKHFTLSTAAQKEYAGDAKAADLVIQGLRYAIHSLKTLALVNVDMNSARVAQLCKRLLINNFTLRHLDLSSNPAITEQDIKLITSSLSPLSVLETLVVGDRTIELAPALKAKDRTHRPMVSDGNFNEVENVVCAFLTYPYHVANGLAPDAIQSIYDEESVEYVPLVRQHWGKLSAKLLVLQKDVRVDDRHVVLAKATVEYQSIDEPTVVRGYIRVRHEPLSELEARMLVNAIDAKGLNAKLGRLCATYGLEMLVVN